MKTTNVLYWISTVLIGGFMLFSGVMSIMGGPESNEIMLHLGYPLYLNMFLGVAKVLGAIALFVPGFPKIRERAYAGFAFDIIGAGYSFRAVGDPMSAWVPMIIIFLGVLAISYIYNDKRMHAASNA